MRLVPALALPALLVMGAQPGAAGPSAGEGWGWRASCPVGAGRIFIELSGAPAGGDEAPVPEDPAALACIAPLQQDQAAADRRSFRKAWRQACACLAGRLESPVERSSLAAAGLLVKWRCRHQRRSLTKFLKRAGLRLQQARPLRCPAPPSAELLRLAGWHLRLRGFVPDEVLDTLAGQGCRSEALQMFDTIFSRRPDLLENHRQRLLERGDVLIDMRIWQHGCRVKRHLVPRGFAEILASGTPERQAAALVYAPDCWLNLLARNGAAAAGPARQPLLEALRLYLGAAEKQPLGESDWLRLGSDGCAVVRFLTATTLARLSDGGLPWAARLGAGEGDPFLRSLWQALARGAQVARPPLVRLSMELPSDPHKGTNSASPNSSR